jgi:hypothetical protein
MEKEFAISDKMKSRFRFSNIILLFVILASTSILLISIIFVAVVVFIFKEMNIMLILFIVQIVLQIILLPILMFIMFINRQTYLRTRIITTPSKIVFIGPGIELHSSWDNLQKVSKRQKLLGLQKYDSILLYKSIKPITKWWSGIVTSNTIGEIPLSMFPDWKESEMGVIIEKMAPHLFITENIRPTLR